MVWLNYVVIIIYSIDYHVRSFEYFIDAVNEVNSGRKKVSDYDHSLASIATTYRTTAILEAGRISLDEQKTVRILYSDSANVCRPTSIKVV